MNRRDKILRHVAVSAKVLEVGPSFNPVVRKADGWTCYSVDHMTAAELRQKYRGHNVDLGRIEEVDFVWSRGPLESAIPSEHHGTFDVCIASHVVEHLPNLVEFFRALSVLLTDSGRVCLALPDKRYCFDYFQPVTMTGDVLEAWLLGRTRHPKRTVYNAAAYAAHAGSQIAWSQHPPGRLSLVSPSLGAAKAAFEEHDESVGATSTDHHGMYFTPSSFELVVTELAHLGLVKYRIVGGFPPDGCEFFVTLERGCALIESEAELAERRISLLKRILLEIREQTDWLLSSRNPLPG
jgi:hypothetical protein